MKIRIPFILSIVVLIAALAACGPSAEAGPVIEPSQTDPSPGMTASLSPKPLETATHTALPTITSTRTQPPDPTLSPTATPIPCNWVNFVGDITVPDNWEIGPGRAFTKTWRLGNIGTCTWTSDYLLVFDHGDQMGAPLSKQLTQGTVLPGKSVDVSVNLVSPAVEGSYAGFFKLRAPDGTTFGIGSAANGAFWVKINVTNATKTPTVTRTSIPTVKPSITPIGSRTPTRIGTPVSLPETQVVTQQVTIRPGRHEYAQARCPDGWVVTGGGFTAPDNLHVYSQHKAELNWHVYAENTGDAAGILTAYGFCLHLPREKTYQFVEAVEVPEGEIGSASIECPAGSVVTGGSFSAIEGSNFLVMNSALSGNGWTASARNDGEGTETFNVHVVCLAENYAGTTAMVTGQGNIAPGAEGYAEVACPSTSVITGGGWHLDTGLTVYSASITGGMWRVFARNSGSTTSALQAYAICLGNP